MAGSESWRWQEVSSSLVFRSKLLPPNAERLLRRSRLFELLDAEAAKPLTVVISPAGTGKTALLASWVAARDSRVAWLSVDVTDHDATQFWTGVVAALEQLVGEGLPRVMRLLHRPRSLDVAVAALLDALAACDLPPSTLLIDDIHLVDYNDEALAALSVFVQHMPSSLHLVLSGRRPPRLPLARLRADGQLGEVDFADLRFSDHEATELLSTLAPSLSQGSSVEVVARTGGWAAGIRLAALAARSGGVRPDEPSTERERLLVSEYLWQEVLSTESPQVVDLLLDISFVERVNAGLAQRLTGRADAGRLLSLAEARGLFVSRLAATDWFEVHSLVRERLRAELRTRSPTRLAELHARAAGWFEEAGEVAFALDHWLLAGRPRDALRLLAAKTTALYDTGRESTVHRVLARLPAEVVETDVPAAIEFAWCFLLLDRVRFQCEVDRAATLAVRQGDLDPTTRGRLTMLHSIVATMRSDWSEGGRLARQAMGDFPDGWWQDFLGRFGWNMIAREVALSEGWHESPDARAARRELSRDAERTLALQGACALGEALTGQPLDALRVAAGVREATAIASLSILRVELAAAEAIAHRELGDREQAATEFESLTASALTEPVAYIGLLARLELTQIYLDEGRRTDARVSFRSAADFFEFEFGGTGGRDWVGRVGTLVALADSDLEGARHWSETIADSFWGPLSRARTQLWAGDRRRALDSLEKAVARCVRHHVVVDLVRSRALVDHHEALKSTAAAADLAAAYGLIQTVASEGADCLRLVELVAWRVPEPWLNHVRRARAGVSTDRVRGLLGVEVLTAREQEVLRLLPGRLSLNEVADELGISMNTLKFHLKVIYRKLGCSSRSEAADIARQAS